MWLLIPILLFSLVYMFVRHEYSHWERKGFPSEKGSLWWSFLKQVYLREFHHVSAVSEIYSTAAPSPFYGIYFFFRSILLVRSVELAHIILQNSSAYFQDVKWDIVLAYRRVNLLDKLAPVFADGRVEGMFRNIEKIADYMIKHVRELSLEQKAAGVDVQQLLRIYSINLMANLVYGLDSNQFDMQESVFHNFIGNYSRNQVINSFSLNHLSKKSALTYRLRDIIRESIESREEGAVIRKDILQLLVKFRNGNEIVNDAKKNWHIENVYDREKVLSIKKLTQVGENFLNIALDVIASTAVFTLYEVLQSPNIMNKVIEEIKFMDKAKSLLENKELTYADVQSLKYLDLCIKETMRKYPGMPIIERVCRKNFNLPDSRHMLTEGKAIMIPILALQRDESNFEEPLIYKPERFLGKDKANAALMGQGFNPGNKVGVNFTKLCIKLALIKLFQAFDMHEINNENLEIAHCPAPVIKCDNGGYSLKLTSKEKVLSFKL